MGDYSVKKNVNDILSEQIDRFRLIKLVNDIYNAINNGTVTSLNGTSLGTTDSTSWDILAGNGTSIVSRAFTSAPVVTSSAAGLAPSGANLVIPNVALIGKSLGGGTTVTATISAGVATITHTSHGYAVGDIVVMSGNTSGSAGDFNQLHIITGVTTNTYTFTTTGTAVSGTILEQWWFSGTRSLGVALVKNVVRSGSATGLFIVTFTNTQPDIYYGYRAWGNISGNLSLHALSNGNTMSTTQCEFFFTGETGTQHDPTLNVRFEFIGIV